VLLTCSYKDREFIRVGYYVNCYLEGDNSGTQQPLPEVSNTLPPEDAAAAVAQREQIAEAQAAASAAGSTQNSEAMASDPINGGNTATASSSTTTIAVPSSPAGADEGDMDADADIDVEDPAETAAKQAVRRPVELDKLWRNILSDRPRVTRFQIPWDAVETVTAPVSSTDGEMTAVGAEQHQQQQQQPQMSMMS
jgi:hypothetical protein